MAKHDPNINANPTAALTLRDHISRMMTTFYQTTERHIKIEGMYDLVMSEVEQPLLEATMLHADGNMAHAASILGLSRDALRKKLQRIGMYPQI
ncbi:MAG: helix-turn-helix domain-containing protein [Gammaproteobacteria bacterium]|nr:helix-turn-helix domain-containing protein [Gammaproteobacteria bacterium]